MRSLRGVLFYLVLLLQPSEPSVEVPSNRVILRKNGWWLTGSGSDGANDIAVAIQTAGDEHGSGLESVGSGLSSVGGGIGGIAAAILQAAWVYVIPISTTRR
jgi:hypothetical protein